MFVILWEISKQTNSTQAQLRLIINSTQLKMGLWEHMCNEL